jgi:hypothetical protein
MVAGDVGEQLVVREDAGGDTHVRASGRGNLPEGRVDADRCCGRVRS